MTREVDPELRKCGRRRSPLGLTQIHKGRGSAFQMICRPRRSSCALLQERDRRDFVEDL